MVDDAAPSPTLLVTLAIDEITECLQLIRFGPSAGEPKRPWWRAGFVRTRAQVVADHRLMYLNENVERARDHWREVLLTVARIDAAGLDNEVLRHLVGELRDGGIDAMAAKLQRSALANAVPRVVAHLDAVAQQMAGYKGLMVKARNQLSLQAMRDGRA